MDIECDSSHGDFPLAKKDCLKLSRELAEWFIDSKKLISKKELYTNLQIVLKDKKNIMTPELSFLDCDKNINDDELDVLCSDIFKIFETKNINKNGNIFTGFRFKDEKDEKVKYVLTNKTEMFHNTSLSVSKSEKDIVISEIFNNDTLKKQYRKSKVSELNKLLNNYIPKVNGDPVIQIVSSFIYFGESKPYKTYAQALDTCDDLENTETI